MIETTHVTLRTDLYCCSRLSGLIAVPELPLRIDNLAYPLLLLSIENRLQRTVPGVENFAGQEDPHYDLHLCEATFGFAVVDEVRLRISSFVQPDPESAGGFYVVETRNAPSMSVAIRPLKVLVAHVPGLLRGMIVTADRVDGLSSILSAESPEGEKVARSSVCTLQCGMSFESIAATSRPRLTLTRLHGRSCIASSPAGSLLSQALVKPARGHRSSPATAMAQKASA